MVYLLVGLFRRPIENYCILKMTKLASEYGVEEFMFNISLAIRGLALNYVVTFTAGISGMAALIVFNIITYTS